MQSIDKKPEFFTFEEGSPHINGRFVNRADSAVSCAITVMYFAAPPQQAARNVFSPPSPRAWVRNAHFRFDLAPDESIFGDVELPLFPDATAKQVYYQCYPQGAVNVHQESCANLDSPKVLDAHKEMRKKKVTNKTE